MGLLEVLATEPDLVLRLSRMLEPRDLAGLESTCRLSRQMFKDCRLWRQRVVEWSRRRHLGTDWLARIGPTEGDFKALVGKVDRLKEQWKQGPLRIKTIDLAMLPVADLAMDETGILVGLRRGLRLYRRHDLHLLWTAACGSDVEGSGSRVSSVALTTDLVLVLPLPSTGPHLWNESICTHLLTLDRATGKLLFTHKLAAVATAILPACKNFVLFPNLHSKHPDELTCYKVN